MPELDYPELSDDVFHKLTDLLFKKSGITLRDHKKYLLIHRISKFVGKNKRFESFNDYYKALINDKSGNLTVEFVNTLTTNFSYFFREEIHFDILKKYLTENYKKESYIRLWSAACSTGEEPYSIAISCLQSIPELNRLDLKILATDISTKVLSIAEEGLYHYTKVRGHIEDRELKTFFNFKRENNSFIVKKSVKDLVSFRYLNLLSSYPFKKNFDVVFLRNVLIYFDNNEKQIAINKLYDYIKPDGYLILGLSESMVGINHRFVPLKNSVYQKKV